MDYLNSVLGSSHQESSVEEAIPTLCDRLRNANLSSDRRSAVLGLKSFSREYRELVVEYGLKALVQTLIKDKENLTLVKAVIETLLILFIRGEGDDDLTRVWISQQSRSQNGKYPSPILMESTRIDQFSLLIADGLTQDISVLSCLIEIIQENEDFHVRLYSVQLLECLMSTRSERTKNCLLSIPTAISVLVSLLNDINDHIKNESILLLMGLVHKNFNIQKLVAFENTFETLFNIILEEGGIRGSILVQDCLNLIFNLLNYNASNQKLFLETRGGLISLAELLDEPVSEDSAESIESGMASVQFVWTEQRVQNVETTLDICKLFVSEAFESLYDNQKKLFDSGILFVVLKLVFSPSAINDLRTTALLTAALIIEGNEDIQFEFSKIDVPYFDPSLPIIGKITETIQVPIALLNWALNMNSVHTFDIRVASSLCLRSYFKGNNQSTNAFIHDQISFYSSCITDNGTVKDENPQEEVRTGNAKIINGTIISENRFSFNLKNIESMIQVPSLFSTLLDYDSDNKLNPYKVWFAAVILIFLFEQDSSLKAVARSVTTGDLDSGEEVMSSIEAMAGLLTTYLSNLDPRPSIGILMLLIFWLYEDPDSVNEFLKEASVIRSLLQFLSSNSSETSELLPGLVCILLGISYEFSSKDSPLPRATLYDLLNNSLGNDNYCLQVKKIADNSFFKDFEESSMFHSHKDETGFPEVFFVNKFVELVKQNLPRIKNAIRHDPNMEPKIHLTYESFESLEEELVILQKKFNEEKELYESSSQNFSNQISDLTVEKSEVSDSLDRCNKKLKLLEDKYSSLMELHKDTDHSLKNLQYEKKKLEEGSGKNSESLKLNLEKVSTLTKDVASLEQKLEITELAKKTAENGINKMSRELMQLSRENDELRTQINKLEKSSLNSKNESEKKIRQIESNLSRLNKMKDDLQRSVESSKSECKKAQSSYTSLETELSTCKEKLKEAESSKEHLIQMLRDSGKAITNLKEEKSKLELQLSNLQSEVKNLEVKCLSMVPLEKHESQVADLKSDLIKAKDAYKNLEAEFAKSTDENKSLTSQIDVLKSNIADLEVSQLNSEGISRDFENQISILNSEKENLKSEVNRLTSECSDLKQKIDDNLIEHNSLLADIRSENNVIKAEIHTLKERNEELNAALENSNAANAEIQKQLSDSESLKEAAQALASSHEIEAAKEREDAAEKKKVLEEKYTEQKMRCDELLKENENFKDEQSAKTKENLSICSEFEKNIKSLKKSEKSLKDEVLALSDKSNSYETELKEAVQKNKETLESLATLEKNYAASKQDSASRIDFLQSEISRLNDECKRNSDLVSTKEKVIRDLEDSITNNNEVDALRKEIKEYRKQIEKLQADCETLRSDLNSQLSKSESDVRNVKKTQNMYDDLLNEYNEKCNRVKTLQSLEEDLKLKDDELAQQKQIVASLALSQAELNESKIELQSSIDDFKKLQQLNSSLQSEVANLKNQNDALKIELENNKAVSKDLQKYKESDAKLSNLEKTLESVRQEMKKEKEKDKTEKAALKRDAALKEDEVSSLVNELESLKKKMEKETEACQKLKIEKEKISKKNVELESKVTATSSELLNLDDIKTRNASLSEELKKMKDQNKESQELNKKLSAAEIRESALRNEIANLQNQLQESTFEASKYVPKNEYDDLMLLVSELDENLKEYKKRLRSHGEDMSSDESDSDSGNEE